MTFDLRDELLTVLNQVDAQIDDVSQVAHDMGIEPVKLRHTSGGWMLAPLLAAKAQALCGLALLDANRELA
jgi:hypothetical protein